MRRVLLGGILAVVTVRAADLPTPQLLSRIRTQMAQTLARLPDYTCRETIQRFEEFPGSQQFTLRDTIRADVAYLGGHELYAWPGSPFEEQTLIDMVPQGTMGTGNFGMLSKAIFGANGPVFFFERASGSGNAKQVRFAFRVSLPYSSYLVHYGKKGAVVPYSGWFTADPDSLDVTAFEATANDIPRELDTLQAMEHVEYARARMGASDYLLPKTSDILLMDLSGGISRNHVTFERCREYRGESTLTFVEPGAIPAKQAGPAQPEQLPPGVELALRLAMPIEGATAAVGDLISAKLTNAIHQAEIAKGTTVTLRITDMDNLTIRGTTYHTVKLSLLRVNAAERPYEVSGATLEHVKGPGSLYGMVDGWISVRGRALHIPAGVEMAWRTK